MPGYGVLYLQKYPRNVGNPMKFMVRQSVLFRYHGVRFNG
jgi:hypothetical protein